MIRLLSQFGIFIKISDLIITFSKIIILHTIHDSLLISNSMLIEYATTMLTLHYILSLVSHLGTLTDNLLTMRMYLNTLKEGGDGDAGSR